MKKGEIPGSSVEPALTTNHRSSGFSRRFAGLAVFVSLVAAACGVGGETPAASQTLPPKTPESTVPVSPSETPFQTLGETSTAVPVTRAGFLSDVQQGNLDKYKIPVTVDQLQTAYNAFMTVPANATFMSNAPTLFADCIDPTQPTRFQMVFCADTTNRSLKAADANGNPQARSFASLMTNYDADSGLFNTPSTQKLLTSTLQS
jgi:hypothetical protein